MTPGRNDPCLCGSGKKYKKCCAQHAVEARGSDTQDITRIPAAAAPDLTPLFALLAAGRNPELERDALGLLARHKDFGILWKLLGAALFNQGKDALAALETAAKLLSRDPESQTNLGNVLRARGRLDEAVSCHRRAIALKPDYAEAHNNLGSALRDSKRPDHAVASYRQAISIKPDFAMAHMNLGDTLLALGRLDEAAWSYRRVLHFRPDSVEAHNNLGNALRDSGRLEEAAASYRCAVAIRPDYAKLHNNLGNALLDLGRIEEAVASYSRALELEPDFAKAHSNLGSAFRELAKLDEAEASYRRALAIRADSSEILTNLGVVQRLQGRADEAEASLRRALSIDPGAAPTITSLAELYADRGQFAEAENLYKKAYAGHPESAQAWAGLAALRKMTSDDSAWIKEAQRIAQRPLRPRDEAHLRYAMGKFFDDVQDYEQAFVSYRRANEIAKAYSPPHDRQHLARTFEFTTRLYDREWLDRAKVTSNSSSRPIFIVGMPRSGTSLAEQILASHPAVFGAGELSFWKTASLQVGSAALESGFDGSVLAKLADEYLQLLTGLSLDASRVVDKMPANFAHLGMIHAALPNARFIHMRRNPIDTCLSIYFQNFHVAHSYANDLEDLAHYHHEYQLLMQHWRSILPPSAILEVPYEALVADQETWSRKMLDFVGLPWDPACIDFHQTNRRVSTFSKWQVRQKISKTSVERWRNYAPFVGPLMHLTDASAVARAEKAAASRQLSPRSQISV
ncbi:MAG TPA: tetratricopeptide repeat protein [Steroidobacteraceae bacterium]|nr:tetratricopeptide repeat protein [Steroidobacteraceae bacterium]